MVYNSNSKLFLFRLKSKITFYTDFTDHLNTKLESDRPEMCLNMEDYTVCHPNTDEPSKKYYRKFPICLIEHNKTLDDDSLKIFLYFRDNFDKYIWFDILQKISHGVNPFFGISDLIKSNDIVILSKKLK